jgi:hypothetical protein
MFTLNRVLKRVPNRQELLRLCALGKSALDEMPGNEALGVASSILGTIQRLKPRSNAALLAGAGLALLSGPRGFSLVRSLFKTFGEIERVREGEALLVVLARLGNQLGVADARTLLAFMAGLGRLDAATRQLALEAAEPDAPHPKLVFHALVAGLPETVSRSCSAQLRNDLLVVRLMTQARPRIVRALRSLLPAVG